MYCQKCGKENPDTNQFCGGCGADLKIVQEITPKNIEVNPVIVSDKEKRMGELHRRIFETKEKIKDTEGQGWPVILAVVGIALIPIIIGYFIIIGAIAWAFMRSNETSHLKSQLIQYENELSRLQGY